MTRPGLLTVEQIVSNVALFGGCYQEVKSLYPKAAEKLLFNEALKRVFDRLVSDLIASTRQHLEQAGVASLENVRSHPTRLAAFSPQVEQERRQIKDFLYENLYYSPALEGEKEDAERIIGELFTHWMEEPDDLPRSYREKAAEEPLARVICDYIAGMHRVCGCV